MVRWSERMAFLTIVTIWIGREGGREGQRGRGKREEERERGKGRREGGREGGGREEEGG